MSYLNPLRLHFAGRFQAAVSTVNNDPAHFDNSTFQPSLQVSPGGWWNPSGNADFRLIGCGVQSAFGADGAPVTDDPVLTYEVADSDRRVPAKLVDLDPQQQMASEIWGLEVRIANEDGNNLLRSSFTVAGFTDIWSRALGTGSDNGMGSMYQSTLTDLEWGDVSGSPFLTALGEAASDGLLSIKFNVDGYNMRATSPDFTYGRIVGTIGPAAAAEPAHFVLGRQLRITGYKPRSITPAGGINYCQAVVAEDAGKVLLDLGNALPTATPGDSLAPLGALTLVAGDVSLPIDADYSQVGWYESTAGVVSVPGDRTLTDAELATLGSQPLELVVAGKTDPAVLEDPSGAYVRADRFVFRLDPGEAADVDLYATKLGAPYPDAEIAVTADISPLQSSPPDPPTGTPEDAISLSAATVTTGPDGRASLSVTASDPGTPRTWIDGQVYAVEPSLAETTLPASPWDFISLLVFSGFAAADPPTWQDIEPTLKQYSNLYPVMSRFLDLGDEQSVANNRDLLLLAFRLDVADPNSMPVTRDLSKAKRAAIVTWLENATPAPPPVPGESPPAIPTRTLAQPVASAAPAAAESFAERELRGGKEAALARRIGTLPAAEPEGDR